MWWECSASHLMADAEEFLNQSIKMSAENEKDYQFLVIKMSDETIAIIFGNIRHYGDIQFRQHVRTQCRKNVRHIPGGGKSLLRGVPGENRSGTAARRVTGNAARPSATNICSPSR